MNPQDHYVYLIATNLPDGRFGPVKIGISSAPLGRLTALQTGCPYPLDLIHSFAFPHRDMALHLEKMFHDVQSSRRVNGEWFNFKDPGEALFLLCMGLEVLLHYNTDLDGELLEQVKERTGLNEAYKKLPRWAEKETLQ